MAGTSVPVLIEQLLPYTSSKYEGVPGDNSSRIDINRYLNVLNSTAISFNALDLKFATTITNHINLCPWEIEYEDAASAETRLRRLQNRHNELDPTNMFTPGEVTNAIKASGKLNTAVTHHLHKGKAANFFLIFTFTPWANFQSADRDGWFDDFPGITQEEKRKMWTTHSTPGRVIAVKVMENTITVYDPTFDPVGPPVFRKDTRAKNRIGAMSGWALVRKLKEHIKRRDAPIKKVVAGGGRLKLAGRREMSCRWLAEQIITEMDPGWVTIPIVGNADWVEVRP